MQVARTIVGRFCKTSMPADKKRVKNFVFQSSFAPAKDDKIWQQESTSSSWHYAKVQKALAYLTSENAQPQSEYLHTLTRMQQIDPSKASDKHNHLLWLTWQLQSSIHDAAL